MLCWNSVGEREYISGDTRTYSLRSKFLARILDWRDCDIPVMVNGVGQISVSRKAGVEAPRATDVWLVNC